MSRQNLPMSKANHDQEILPVVIADAGTAKKQEKESFSPYRILHQYLRGRYIPAIGMGLILAGLMAYGGYRSTKPLYQSEALIRVSYEVPRVMQTVEDYRPFEAFHSLIQSQQQLIASHRVLSGALKDPVWNDSGFDVEKLAIDDFASDLKVEAKGENLKVKYASADRQFAAMAVRTIVNSYVDVYNSIDKQLAKEMTAALDARREELLAQVDDTEALLQKESAEYGSANIERFYEAAVTRLTRVEQALIEVRIALALTDGPRGRTSGVYSPQQIARFDQTMARYMAEKEQLEMQLQQYRLRGFGEENKFIQQTQSALEMVVSRIEDYAMDFQASAPAAAAVAPALPTGPGATVASAPASNPLMGRSMEELRMDEQNLNELTREAKESMAALGAHKLKLDALQAQVVRTKEEIAEVTEKMARLHVDSGLSSRLNVLSNGEVPLLAFRDRRLHLAAAGGLVGMMLPAAGIVGYGMTRRRYRFSADASDDLSKSIPLLGILPQLPERITDPESAADAAQCLHQIRVMLQVQQASHGSMSYLMTSSCPGEGKTSLTAALALSFAAAGARTVVVDADLIGQRLSRGYRLDEKPGFREAMLHGAKEVPLYDSGVENLTVLPAGVSDGRDACAVSAKVARKLLATLKEEYDVVLIDSGPILGSLEALVLAGHVDGVVLTISREQQKPLVDRAIRQLHSMRAKVAGMVFNKAKTADFKRSVGASSLRSIPRNPESAALVKVGMTSTSGFGSLVDSVQTYMPQTAGAV